MTLHVKLLLNAPDMALSCVKTTDNIDTSVDMSIMPNSIIHLNPELYVKKNTIFFMHIPGL